MGPRYDDREPQEEPTREPLVDLNVKPPRPGDPSAESKPRRKRLSDMEPEGDKAPTPPQADRQRRRSLTTRAAEPEKPPAEAESSPEPRRPRLVNIAAAPGEQEPRLKVGRARTTITQSSEEPPSGSESSPEPPRRHLADMAAPGEQEPRLKVGRTRATITHSFEDTRGLQNLIDPPHLAQGTVGPAPHEEPARAPSHVDPAQVEQLVTELRAKQNFSIALVGGLTAAVVGAILWAVITVATNYQIGWMAVGVGFLVGGAVRTLGRGIDKSFGYLGAAMSVFGCVLGNLLSICAVVASQEGLSPVAVVAHIGSHPAVIPAALLATFHPMDLLFYAIAVYEGYRFSFRQVTEADLSRVTARN
jgi:hypothetical protein